MKRFIAFLMLCMLCFAFVACGLDAPNGPQKETVKAHDVDSPPPPPSGAGGG